MAKILGQGSKILASWPIKILAKMRRIWPPGCDLAQDLGQEFLPVLNLRRRVNITYYVVG